jgi:hypothetical protein
VVPYTSLFLNCSLGSLQLPVVYINKTMGQCVSQSSLGGMQLLIYTTVLKDDIYYQSSSISRYVVVPDSVTNIKMTQSFNDSLFFSWQPAQGLIDSYLVTCSLLTLGVVLSAKAEANTSSSSSCINLLPSSTYEVYISSIRNVENKMYSNGANAFFNTRNFY